MKHMTIFDRNFQKNLKFEEMVCITSDSGHNTIKGAENLFPIKF